MKKITHNELVEKFAQAKCTIYTEIPLGSVWMSRPQIADVLRVNPSYTRFLISIYECKVSRSDFLSDLRSEKWKGYLQNCHTFSFVTLKGITDVQEIPENVGLILLNEKGFYTRKVAKVINNEIPIETMMAIMFYKNKILRNLMHRHWMANNWYDDRRRLKKLGKNVEKAVSYYRQSNPECWI